jgi:hypothetical protein
MKKQSKHPTRNHLLEAKQGHHVREPITPEQRAELHKSPPRWTCWHCMFYLSDVMLWAKTLLSGFPISGLCANNAETPGRIRPAPSKTCRNFRLRPFRTDPPEPPNDKIRYIPLTRGVHAIVDAEDYEWLSKHKWQVQPSPNGDALYAKRCERGRLILMHREIMKPPKGKFVDHFNGNGLDNRRCNLRICDPRENCCNRSKRANAKQKYIGVQPCGKHAYTVTLMHKGKTYREGKYRDEVEAATARDRLALKHHGPYAHLNFPPEETEAEREETSSPQ